jgi:hypothetical protein
MRQIGQNSCHAPSRVALFVNTIMAECEDFGSRYQYSPRLMLLGAVFAAFRLYKAAPFR